MKTLRIWCKQHLQQLILLHLFLLIAVRILVNSDDFNNWDLIPFLNSNAANSLHELMTRREVHFLKPFSFPQYNVGAESTIAALLFRGLGHVSLYWSVVFVLAFFDAIFIYLFFRIVRMFFSETRIQNLALALLSMSPVVLTFASTSAFNMQGYLVVISGILAAECFLQHRIEGICLFALAFLFISQAYPLSFFLPYYLIVWLIWRSVLIENAPNSGANSNTLRQNRLSLFLCGLVVVAFTLGVNWISSGAYFRSIQPTNPYGAGLATLPQLLRRLWFFLQQAYYPTRLVDNVQVGFASYFLQITVISVVTSVLARNKSRFALIDRRIWWGWKKLLLITATIGLLFFGYLPGYLNPIMKSQRIFVGEIFFIIVSVMLIKHFVELKAISFNRVASIVAICLVLSDGFYLYFSLSVNHQRNHYPVFDFDLSDGSTRHDLISAIKQMKEQVHDHRNFLIIEYPHGYSENNTDPGMFFAHFLRHFGRFKPADNLFFSYQWCDKRYSCPFPNVLERDCAVRGCYQDPIAQIITNNESHRRTIVWQWIEKNVNPPSTLNERTFSNLKMNDITRSLKVKNWRVYESSN